MDLFVSMHEHAKNGETCCSCSFELQASKFWRLPVSEFVQVLTAAMEEPHNYSVSVLFRHVTRLSYTYHTGLEKKSFFTNSHTYTTIYVHDSCSAMTNQQELFVASPCIKGFLQTTERWKTSRQWCSCYIPPEDTNMFCMSVQD